MPSGKCQVLAFDVTSLGEFYAQLEEKSVADPEVELRCKKYELYASLSETEMILRDPVRMKCYVKEGCGWYRAGKLVIQYVDYGGTATIDRQNVKQIDRALCKLVIQCCLAGVRQTYEKGWSIAACGLTEEKHLTAVFLTSDTLPYTGPLWNKTTNVSDEMMSALPDDDA